MTDEELIESSRTRIGIVAGWVSIAFVVLMLVFLCVFFGSMFFDPLLRRYFCSF